MEQGHSGTVVQVCFPVAQTAVLDGLNRQREEGRFCDLSIHVQGQVFKAHRCVLAASSPYFHDQVLLKNMSTVSIPAVMDPLAFESVLRCAYTGQLRMLRDDIVNYLTVGSVLQMWHIVDKCTELLREAKGGGGGGGGGGGSGTALVSRGSQENPEGGGGTGENPSGSSSSVVLLHSRSADHQPPHHHHHQSHGRPSLSESQSPSSTNYFSPREANCGGGGGSASTSGSGGEGQGQGLSSTPSYCAPSGRSEETFLIEGDEDDEDEGLEEEEEEDDTLYLSSRKRERGRHRRKKLSLSGCDQGVGISDSFGVSSYQDGDVPSPPPPPQKRPTYSQPSIMPRKQWVVVKTERSPDDELIVVSGGEEGGEDDDEEDKELEMARERARELERERAFSISNVRTLSDELSSRAEAEMETQVDYCQSSEDYLKYDSGLLDHPSQQHPLDHTGQGSSSSSSSRSISALLGPLQSAAARAQLFPLDMQGNQILLYSQAALDASSPLGMGSGLSGSALKGPGLEHGAAHLSGQGGGLEGLDAMAPGGAGGSGGKVFMCHCGKTFTHKSMRDRHINMHLDLRPFHCPVCAKKFKMKHHLTEHMKTHTGLKPYVCSGCGKKFMWRDSFMRHRSQCERRGIGGGGGGGGGSSMEAGGSQDAQGLSPTHPLQSDAMQVGSEGRNGVRGRGGLGGGSPHHQPSPGGGGGGGGSMPCLGMAGPVSLLGIGAQGLGSGIFGLGMSRGPCEDDVCEVSVDESNIA